MAVLPTMEVPAGRTRRLATLWFSVLVVGFLVYSIFSVVQAAHRWNEPATTVEYVASDFPLPTISLCNIPFFDLQGYPELLGITASCWDTRNINSPKLKGSYNVSNFPLQDRRLNDTIILKFANLPGDCEATPLIQTLPIYPGWQPFRGVQPYEFCLQFRTDLLPGLAQSLGQQPLISSTTGIVRLTFSLQWATRPEYVSGFYLKSNASKNFFGSTEEAVYRSSSSVSGDSSEQATPVFTVKTYLNGTKLVQQAWDITATNYLPKPEYDSQFRRNSTSYQLSIFPNALGVLNIKERSSVNVPVLLSQFASAWSAVILLFGLCFSRSESREFVLEPQLEACLPAKRPPQGTPHELYPQETPQDLYPPSGV